MANKKHSAQEFFLYLWLIGYIVMELVAIGFYAIKNQFQKN